LTRRPYFGALNAPESSFSTSGNRNGSGASQSVQRNLRPPLLTSMNFIGF
jgi:hypothetical protein